MSSKHRYLWLGSYQSDAQFQKMLARNIGQASGYASQKGLVKGFDEILDVNSEMDTLGVVSYPPYPVYPQKWVKQEKWSRTGTSRDCTIGYLDIKYITYLSRSLRLNKEVRWWAKERIGKSASTIIVYEPSVSKLKAALDLKKRYQSKVFVVIPDIPELVNLGASTVIKIGKKLAAKQMRKLFKFVDGFILYSECMAQYYGFQDDQWILMEGVFDPDEAVEVKQDSDEKHPIRLMYCGALDKYRGIPQLLEAFEQLRDKDYELWFCGAGPSDALIHEKEKLDKRIHHFGYLDARDDVLALQRQADVLIHTRDITSPAAPYCFPSKLFEYFVTAKPVISVKLPGIPKEYYDYMIPIEPFNTEGIEQAIRRVGQLSAEERKRLGISAREFVLNKKNSATQAKKIYEFMKESQGIVRVDK